MFSLENFTRSIHLFSTQFVVRIGALL